MDVDGDDLLDIGQFQLGHRELPASNFAVGN